MQVASKPCCPECRSQWLRHNTHNSLKGITEPEGLHGHATHVRLKPPAGRPQDIIGVYMPTSSNEHSIRLAVGGYIIAATAACEREGEIAQSGM